MGRSLRVGAGWGYAHRMSFWIHTLCLRADLWAPLTWLAHLLMTVGGLCVRVCVRPACDVRPSRGRSRISRRAAFRELRCPQCKGCVSSRAHEGAGGAVRCAGGEEGRLAFPSACPGAPQPWRRVAQDASPRPAAVPSAVVGRDPACEAVHELRAGIAGDGATESQRLGAVQPAVCDASSLPVPSLSPSSILTSSPRRRGSIRRARTAARAVWLDWRGGQAGPTGPFRTSTPREVMGWIPACAGMTKGVGGRVRVRGVSPTEGGARLA